MAGTPPDPGIEVREATLPGIGKKYVMPLRTGGNLVIVVRPDGERHLYHFLEHDDRPSDAFTLDEDEAQQVANLLGRALVPAPDLEDLDLVLGALELDWVELPDDAPVVGHSLGSSQLRTRTGASLVAILRGGRAIANPGVDVAFEAGDTLVLIGSHDQTDAARALVLG